MGLVGVLCRSCGRRSDEWGSLVGSCAKSLSLLPWTDVQCSDFCAQGAAGDCQITGLEFLQLGNSNTALVIFVYFASYNRF